MLAIIYKEESDKLVLTELDSATTRELTLPEGPNEYQYQSFQEMSALPTNTGVIVSFELDDNGAISQCVNLKSFMIPEGTIQNKILDESFRNLLSGVGQNLLDLETQVTRVLH